MFQHQKIKNY